MNRKSFQLVRNCLRIETFYLNSSLLECTNFEINLLVRIDSFSFCKLVGSISLGFLEIQSRIVVQVSLRK